MAIFLALRIIVSRFSVPVGVNLNISFSFILVALSGILFGPATGALFAFAEDILEFLLFPSSYGFFFGYTLSAILGVWCYAFFLYDSRITVLKLIVSKALSSFAVNVLLGSFWTWILTGKSKAYLYYAAKSLVKNATLFPVQILLLVIVLNMVLPFLSSRKYIRSQTAPIPWI